MGLLTGGSYPCVVQLSADIRAANHSRPSDDRLGRSNDPSEEHSVIETMTGGNYGSAMTSKLGARWRTHWSES